MVDIRDSTGFVPSRADESLFARVQTYIHFLFSNGHDQQQHFRIRISPSTVFFFFFFGTSTFEVWDLVFRHDYFPTLLVLFNTRARLSARTGGAWLAYGVLLCFLLPYPAWFRLPIWVARAPWLYLADLMGECCGFEMRRNGEPGGAQECLPKWYRIGSEIVRMCLFGFCLSMLSEEFVPSRPGSEERRSELLSYGGENNFDKILACESGS